MLTGKIFSVFFRLANIPWTICPIVDWMILCSRSVATAITCSPLGSRTMVAPGTFRLRIVMTVVGTGSGNG